MLGAVNGGRTDRVDVDVVVAVALAAVAVIVFAPAVAGPFFWDDDALIVGNPLVHSLSNYRTWFVRDFWGATPELTRFTQYMRYYRPLVTASYALDWRLGGGDPAMFHATNLVAHAAAVVLVYFALVRWGARRVAAGIGTLVFAVHPSKAESVAWIAGRTDIFCTLAMLAAGLGAARRFRGQRLGLALEIVATAIAYMTKEAAILMPVLIALERWSALDRPAIDRPVAKRLALAALPQLAFALAYLAARAKWMPLRPVAPNTSLVDHAQFFFESVGRYVGLALGAHEYSSQHALLQTLRGRWVHSLPWVTVGAVAVVALTAVAVRSRHRAPAVTLGIAFFAASLLPVSNLVLTGLSSLVAERFLYAPLIGVALVVAFTIDALPHRTVRGVAIAVTALAAGRAFVRAIDFSDPVRFWTRELALHPVSVEPRRFLLAEARKNRHYRTASTLALEGRAIAAEHFAHTAMELELVVAYIEIAALLTPDRSEKDLRALDAFLTAVVDPVAPSAEVRTSTFEIAVAFDAVLRNKQPALRGRVALAHADILSRLGDDETALGWIEAAERECATCALPLSAGAIIAARQGNYARAYGLLDRHIALRGEGSVATERQMIQSAELAHRQAEAASGAVALNLRARELSLLEAWGRGYAVLAPYRVQIEAAPGFALGFAELAFRAGERDVALQVARKQLPEEKLQPTLDQWARKMGWLD